jgi:Protein of unknown function (DUF3460)
MHEAAVKFRQRKLLPTMSLLLRIFRRPDYDSEITQFISELKAKKPDLEAQQRAGRAIWWDKQVNREAWDEFRAAQVRQKPYVYQTDTP